MANLSALKAASSSAQGSLLWSLLVEALANQRPPSHEQQQGFERRLAIRRWQPWLPDAGHVGQLLLGPALN